MQFSIPGSFQVLVFSFLMSLMLLMVKKKDTIIWVLSQSHWQSSRIGADRWL